MMKKALLPLAIAAVLPVSAMAMGPIDGTLYGKVNLSVDSYDFDDGSTPANNEDQMEVNSNASRIGVKGKTELSEGLHAIYKAEFEIYVDDGKSSSSKGSDTFEQRNIYVGLTGSYGTVFAGRHDTPTKLSQKKIDLFGDLNGDIKNTFEGENRADNVVVYASPTMNGFQATAAFVAAEDSDVDGDGNPDDGFDGSSIGISYTNDNLYLSLSQDSDVDAQDLTRFVAQYQIDALKLGFMYQDSDFQNGAEEDGYFVSAAYKIDKVTLKAQYGKVEGEDAANLDREEETLSLGVDYKLAKSTKAFVYYTENTDKQTDNTKDTEKTMGVGMEHKF